MNTQANSQSSVQSKKSKVRVVLPIVAVLLLVVMCGFLALHFRVISVSGEGESYVLEANHTQLGILIIEENASATLQEKSLWIGPIISIQGELTVEEKEINRNIARIRIRVEHAIGGVKRYRIVKDQLRNWKQGFRDQVMETCCGLHNFRLNFRPWVYFSSAL